LKSSLNQRNIKKQVTVFGASGLIGGLLVQELIKDTSISKIHWVSRSPVSTSHPKIVVFKIDFLDLNQIEKSIKNSTTVFSSIGTTKAKVGGDKAAYRKIDYDINLSIANSCLKLQIDQFQLVSSGGADVSSSNFYLSLKGEMEQNIFDLRLPSVLIFRPSLLLGKRNEFRFGERIAQLLMPLFIFSNNYKPIKAERVAQQMNAYAKLNLTGNHIVSNAQLVEGL
jgi:uncharacterized protein YbjT (DUF2867 family)